MRRLVIVAVLVASLVSAAIALAVNRDFQGHVTGHANDEITFTVVRQSGVDKKVKDVVIHRIGVECDGGHQRITPPISGTAPIDSGGGFTLDSGNTHFAGDVSGAQASGHLRVKGSFSGSSQNCDSGKVGWTASH